MALNRGGLFQTKRAPPTCVNFYMLVERVPLCKRSEANFTFERFGSSVDSVMVFQVLLGGKALPARFTHKRPFPCGKGEKGELNQHSL